MADPRDLAQPQPVLDVPADTPTIGRPALDPRDLAQQWLAEVIRASGLPRLATERADDLVATILDQPGVEVTEGWSVPWFRHKSDYGERTGKDRTPFQSLQEST